MFSRLLSAKLRDTPHIVYARRFQPPLNTDVDRIVELASLPGHLIIAVVQICYDPEQEFSADSLNNPLLNPFSFWERSLMLEQILESRGITSSLSIIPLQWYQYELTPDDLSDPKRRLWIADRIDAYFPSESVFCLESDDIPLINFLQQEVGAQQMTVFGDYILEPPNFVSVQHMMVNGGEWRQYVPGTAVKAIEGACRARVKMLWREHGPLTVIEPYLTATGPQNGLEVEIMNKETATDIVAHLSQLYQKMGDSGFSRQFPQESQSLKQLIIQEISDLRTILSELDRLEDQDVYGKDPSLAQDRYTLTSRLQSINTRLEMETLPEITRKLMKVSDQASQKGIIPAREADDLVSTLRQAVEVSETVVSWASTLTGAALKLRQLLE
jgi:hypothetical protein